MKVFLFLLFFLVHILFRHKVEIAMRNYLKESVNTQSPFIIHIINDPTIIGDMPLQAATNLCTTVPILVIGIGDGILNARCCVPQVKLFSTTILIDLLTNISIFDF